MDFRHIPKQRVDILVPEALEGRLRAARGRQSLSQVVASALCLLFDEDPRGYGLLTWGKPSAGSRTGPGSPATRPAPAAGSPSGGPAR